METMAHLAVAAASDELIRREFYRRGAGSTRRFRSGAGRGSRGQSELRRPDRSILEQAPSTVKKSGKWSAEVKKLRFIG